MHQHYDLVETRAAAHQRWDMILEQLAPEIRPALDKVGRHMPCPVHGGKDGFRVFKNVAETGGGICNTCGNFHDGFALLMWLRNWTFREALISVSNLLGTGSIPEISARPRPVHIAPERADIRKRLSDTWANSIPITDPKAKPLRAYLHGRGIPLQKWLHLVPEHEDVLRFHPSLSFYEEGELLGRWPAMIAMVTQSNGSPVNLHRTYIAHDGSGKAPVNPARKLMSPYPGRKTPGSAIRLGNIESGLCQVTEGIETALAVMVARQKPVWSTISDTFMASFIPPPGTHSVVIWADKDREQLVKNAWIRPGEHYAEKLRERLSSEGYATRVLVPSINIPDGDKSVDWNDILVRYGAEHIGPQQQNHKSGVLSKIMSVWRAA